MEIRPNHPSADHVTEAVRCFEVRDAAGCDRAYRAAVAAAVRDPGIREELQEDHLNCLATLGNRRLARDRCEGYLAEHAPRPPLGLRLLYAEILVLVGDHARAGAAADAIADSGDELSKEQEARLHRVRGLVLSNAGQDARALRHLLTARAWFESSGQPDELREIDKVIRAVRGREGEHGPVAADAPPPVTVVDHLRRAEELRHEARYEEALETLTNVLDMPEFNSEPDLHWPVVRELAVLAWALRRPDLVGRLGGLLGEAAGHAPDRAAAQAEADSLLGQEVPEGGPLPRRFDARVEYVHRLLEEDRTADAEKLLVELRDQAASRRDHVLWHLAAAEVEQARADLSPGDPAPLHECVGHATVAANLATTGALQEARVAAWRILGNALRELDHPGADDAAMEFLARAHRLEEEIAGRQPSDRYRVPMLAAVPTEHDERVRATVERVYAGRSPTAAPIAVALEAARGALVLPLVLPADEDRVRDLPGPGDPAGALRWARGMAAALPRDQAAWLIHTTPDTVHHVIVCRKLQHSFAASNRAELHEAIDDLALCWETTDSLEASAASGEFERRLAEIAARLAVAAVVGRLPAHIRRLAVVAGNEVADVPLAGLPLPDGGGPLGLRYALSDLPCLSALAPLRARAHALRGDDLLLVRPGNDGLAPSTASARVSLSGPSATPERLREELAKRSEQIVRIDSHGLHDHDEPGRSLIRLAGSPLSSQELEQMDLRGCGTLVLGACESGMAQRLGRDERHGFVRAGFTAGAASVVAARWIAPDLPARALLDRLQHHLRVQPRDLALRAAMRDVHATDDVGVPFPRDPSRWACWTLYGDAGLQTRAGLLRRRRRGLAERRRRRSEDAATRPE
ncbi:CHAT domain-containing protein [Actinomadura terrae]|uniref:CHAT domain-containing protein n=1 Tax=Actinomadura terrae TaxID=604353 RepID=UPI001FA73A30|nr:CHAT domain-containing protein [Actinomadura terrae]